MATIRILISYVEGKTYGDPLPNKNFEFKIINIMDYDRNSTYKLIREFKPDIILTVGNEDPGELKNLNFEWRKRWSHIESFDNITEHFIEKCFMYSVVDNPKDDICPLISVVSTAYKSGERILRPYNSLISQTYTNWEWIIYDDSEDNNDTWNRLNELYEKDYRITLIRSNKNDGKIGSVKFKASMISRGKYMVELDHDDIMHPDALQWIIDAGKLYPDAGFLYTSTCPIFEESESCLIYGEYVGFGYCGYEAIKLNGRWMYCLGTAKINPMSIYHLVGMPNHLRVFRTDLYRKIGGNNSRFSVSDDYEVMIKAFLETKFVCIPEPGYTQYHNKDGNNFTYLRNSLIQLLVRYIYNYYEPQINKRFESLGLGINGLIKNNYKCWEEVEKTHYPTLEHIYFPNYDKCISIILPITPSICSTLHSSENLKSSIQTIIQMLYSQKHTIWRLHISASKVDILSDIMNNIIELCDDRIRWWNMSENKNNDELTAKNYGLRIMAKSKYVSYINLNTSWSTDKLEYMLSQVNQCDSNNKNEYYLDKDNTLIHANNDKFAYWLPYESTHDFILRCCK